MFGLYSTTHGAAEAIQCCHLLADLLANALEGRTKDEVFRLAPAAYSEPRIRDLATGNFRHKRRDEVKGTGSSVASLEAALWCFWHSDSFEAAVLEAANLGDDADTTAAITGQLAGAFYGRQGIPSGWFDKLHMGKEIEDIALALFQSANSRAQAS